MRKMKKIIIGMFAMALLMMSNLNLVTTQAEWVEEYPVLPGLQIAEGTSWTNRPSAWGLGYRPFDMGFRFTVRSNEQMGLDSGIWQQGNITIPWGFYDFIEPTMIPWSDRSLQEWNATVTQLAATEPNVFSWQMTASGEVIFIALNLVNVSGRGEVDLNWASARTEVGLYVRGTLRNRFMLHPGDDVVFLFEPQWGMGPIINNYDRNILKVIVNGSMVMDETLADRAEENFELRTLGRMSMAIPPLVVLSADMELPLGTAISEHSWVSRILGRWGHTSEKAISELHPANGSITDTSLVDDFAGTPTDFRLSSNGVEYDRIGVVTHNYEIRDTHSLSPLFPFDTTMVETSRKISVVTTEEPEIWIVYVPGLTGHDGHLIPTETPYDENMVGINVSGGEEGWTKENLYFRSRPTRDLGSTFQNVLQVPDKDIQIIGNHMETFLEYGSENPPLQERVTVEAMLTEIGDATNVLSGVAERFVKIDKTPPIAHAVYEDREFIDKSEDALSGLSELRPSKIALVPIAEGNAEPAEARFTEFDDIPERIRGEHYVWIWATDKAGNITKTMLPEPVDILLRGVSISKNTDIGATLHAETCDEAHSIKAESGCEEECVEVEEVGIEEKTNFQYQLTLTNEEPEKIITGTFIDYLPKGVVVLEEPTFTPANSIENLEWELVAAGQYAGRYKVTGDYMITTQDIQIYIESQTPAHEEEGANIISNQATLTWESGFGDTLRAGNVKSNYANHQVMKRTSVATKFTKVGADDLNTGLAGAEFVLYRWETELLPSEEEIQHIVNISAITDGHWERVHFDGEITTSLTDNFVSSALGEVDFGNLPKGIYTLIETKAPAGYEVPVGQWILTIAPENDNTGEEDYQIEFVGKTNFLMPPAATREIVAGEVTYKIINAKAFSIGMSGLGGTRGILLMGFVFMALGGNAYFAFVYKEKKTADRNTKG